MKTFKHWLVAEELTLNPQAKGWFGHSKIVDENGKPLVVFHGTPQHIAHGTLKRSDDGLIGPGIYLTPNAEYASSYATGDGGNVMPFFAKVLNPLFIESDGRDEPFDIALKIATSPTMDAYFMRPRAWARQQAEDWSGIGDDEFVDLLRDAKHDGVVLRDKQGKILELTVLSQSQLVSAVTGREETQRWGF